MNTSNRGLDGGTARRYDWSRLNRQQIGRYAEYFTKLEFTLHGSQVYTAEVDDRGIDFVVRTEDGKHYDIQVKSLRERGYVFARKEHFQLRDNLCMAFVLFREGVEPDLYLIPSTAWKRIDPLFRDREYEGLKSAPEWGLNVSKKNFPLLEEYRFATVVERF